MITLPDHKNTKASDFTGSPVFLLTGKAGSGKTTLIRKMIEEDQQYGILAATTGIAAVNLGAGITTINSLLKFTTLENLKYLHARGKGILGALRALRAKDYRWLIIDEVSMMSKDLLDIIITSLDAANKSPKTRPPLGLMLVGDFAQLPPINNPWVFESEHWKRFDNNILKLTESYRQSSPEFIDALNSIRVGNKLGGFKLRDAGCSFASKIDIDYEGCMLFSTNEAANNFNSSKLSKLDTEEEQLTPSWWTTLVSDRGEYIVPADNKEISKPVLVKEGSLVMILSNDTNNGFRYANGDMGYVMGFGSNSVYVQLIRNMDTVEIFPVKRKHLIDKNNYMQLSDKVSTNGPDVEDQDWGEVREDTVRDDMLVAGEIRYFPLRLAWACTIHKTQGLTLDKIQIDIQSSMFRKTSGMTYVALSRAREAEGVRIIGSPLQVYNSISVDPKVKASNLL